MKIKVHDLPEGELIQLDHEYNAGAEDLEFYDLHYTEPIVFLGNARKEADCLFIEGTVSSSVEHVCARCLAAVKEPVNHPVKLSVVCKDIDEVDITGDIRERLIFEHPMKYVCSPECKGLCPICGKNLNKEQCDCSPGSAAGPFSDLKKLL
ncbi:MAG: DUF177 domain-containing protein [Candidatus Omnitrophica bacterium]|nr:DUF177 domain-containing protein [Candidatus Omnitrophota bacterium]